MAKKAKKVAKKAKTAKGAKKKDTKPAKKKKTLKEVWVLNELSPGLLGRYVGAASQDLYKKREAVGDHTARATYDRSKKRSQEYSATAARVGILTRSATARLSKSAKMWQLAHAAVGLVKKSSSPRLGSPAVTLTSFSPTPETL